MARSARSVVCCALLSLSIWFLTRPAPGLIIGGWNSARGEGSGILFGTFFSGIRTDVDTYFPGVTFAETGTLTTSFLNSIDVLLITPVAGDINVEVPPLDGPEQTALSSWVSDGGRAMVMGENLNYHASSSSMINPFGPTWQVGTPGAHAIGTVTDHSSFPALTDGPFGAVNTYGGDFPGYFQTVSPATPLGTWDVGGESLAAMNFGSGKVVIYGDVAMLSTDYEDNIKLRRNMLAYLLGVAPHSPYDYNLNGLVDAADYVLWRKTFGTTGFNLPADGSHNSEIDPVDYDLWRGEFGLTGFTGPGASNLAAGAVPEPTSLTLLLVAAASTLLRRSRKS